MEQNFENKTVIHNHDHEHEHRTMHELLAFVAYMCEHNVSHIKELLELGESLKKNDNMSAFEKLSAAAKEYEKGNKLLQEALNTLKR